MKGTGPTASRSGRALSRAVLIVLFAGFVFLALAHVFADGVCCADDGLPAIVAKNLARGLGYSCTVQVGRPHYTLRPFDESVTTGPTVVLPASLAMVLFGNRYWVPGAVAVLCWVVLMIAAFRALGGLAPPGSARLASMVFLASAFAVTPYHFEQWYALLGEVPAFLFVVLAALVWARRPSDRRRVFAASALLSLALLTKLLTLLYYVGFLLVLCLVLLATRRLVGRGGVRTLAASGAGFLLPLGAFQAWKLIALGPWVYRQRLVELVAKTRHEGLSGRSWGSLPLRITDNAQTLFDRFGVSFALLTILAVGALLLVLASRRCHLTLAAAPLFAGFVLNVGWWLLFSPGRPRYVLIGVLVVLALASLTLVAQPALPRRVLIVATLVVVVAPNWGRWAFPFSGVAAHGWFKPSRSTANALETVSVLDGELGGKKLTGQWWATVVDLEYLSSGAGRFDRFDPSAPPRPGEERLIAVNTKFLNKGDAAFTRLLQSCGPPLLDAPPYLVLQCPPEPISPGHASL